MRTGAVIAAAGRPGGYSSYDGLEHIKGSSMVRRMISTFRRAGVEDIVIVTGYRAEETEKDLVKLGAVFLRMDNYEDEQMLDFAVRGISYLADTCDRIFFCPADVPLFSEKTVREMMDRASPVVIPVCGERKGHPVFLRMDNYEDEQMLDFAVRGISYLADTCDRIFFCPADVPLFSEKTVREMMDRASPVVIPVCGERKGHPVLIDAELSGRIASYVGERGLKGALDDSGAETAFVQVDDRGVLAAAGKDPGFEDKARYECPARIYPKVKVQLVRNVPFFGPGMMVILKQIQILGNVREACEKAGMSYSKGWSLIHTAEKELGWVIVERSPGGKYGGTARVSEKGLLLMNCYEQLERELAEEAEKKYNEIFGESGLDL